MTSRVKFCRSLDAMPWLVLALCLAITFILWRVSIDKDLEQAGKQFRMEVTGYIAAIKHRMEVYEYVIGMGVGFVNSSEHVTRAGWRTFITKAQIQQHFPGILGVGLSVLIPPEKLELHILAMRKEQQNYTFYPPGNRYIYSAAVYFEPLDEQNKYMIGWDMLQKPVYKTAMLLARDTGKAAISSKTILAQETMGSKQAGNVIYLPVYQQGASVSTVAERRQAIIGFVFATFRMGDLMNGITGNRVSFVDFHLFDAASVTDSSTLMYGSDNNLPNNKIPKYQEHRVITVSGRKWTILFQATPEFVANINFDRSRIILIGGILCGFLLFGFTQLPLRSRRLAINLAEKITADLRVSEARTRVILDTVVNAIVTIGADQRILSFNPAAEKMFGYTADEVLGKKVNILMPEPFCSEHDQYVANYLHTGQKKIIGQGREVIGRRWDGRIFPIWLAIDAAKFDNETIFVGCMVDISKRKTADEKIRTLSLAVEYSPVIAMITDSQGDVVYVNSQFAAITGYSATDIIGHNWLFNTNCMTNDEYEAIWRTILKGEVWRGEMYNQKKHEGFYWAAVAIAAIRDEPDKIAGFIILQEDITTRKETEKLLVAAKEAAEVANRAKSAFLANMSHELRTPLNAVLGYAQILQSDPTLGEVQRHGVNIMRRSGEHLLTLINDVLDLSKVEAGHLELFPNDFDLRDFFSEITDMFRIHATEKRLTFNYQPGHELPSEVNADEKRLRQICMNLLGNAMKFTEQGEVRLEADYQNGDLIISVIDTGVGIVGPMREQIFTPFVQTGHKDHKQQGTGLGLAISRNLIERMGGYIELESELGKGSCFRVHVPISVVKTAPVSKEATGLVTGFQRTDGIAGSIHILVVDDIAENRAVLRGLLEPFGFEITEAVDGAEAIALTATQTFELILMDLVMPKLDGLTATHNILARPDGTNRSIIALTASAFEEDRAASQAVGCLDYLVKPIEQSTLLQTLGANLPLEWEYTQPIIPIADATTPNQESPLDHDQCTVLMDLVQRGAIHKIISYLEQLIETPDCPGQAHVLLELIKEFKLSEMRHLLESALQTFDTNST